MKLVDWGVLAYWAVDHPRFGAKATKILRHVERSEKAVTTSLDLFICDAALRQAEVDGYALDRFLKEVERLRNLRIEPMDAALLDRGAQAAQRFGVPLEVAVGYAAGRHREADAVYSFNEDYDRTDLPRRVAP